MRDDISDTVPFDGIASSLRQRWSLPRLALRQPPQKEGQEGNDYEAADNGESCDNPSAQTVTTIGRAGCSGVRRPVNDTLPDTFTERARAQRKPIRPKQVIENCLTKRTRRTAVAGDGENAVEFVNGGGQVRGRYPSAKSGVGYARALEVLAFPFGRVGIGDRLHT